MADVTINYKGEAIATMNASGTKTLLTEGKYCEDDIEIEYVKSGGGGSTLGTKTITANDTYDASDDDLDGYSQVTVNVPASAVDTGTKNINTNGTHDVTGYASADVSVPASAVDSGTKSIATNGTHDVVGYASASVNVPASAVDSGTKSITSNGNNQDVVGYAAVNVNVPNSYAAGDEGKVVSNGALVAQGSDTVTQNGTVDTTLISSLSVNVSGGGGGSKQTKTGTFTGDGTTSVQISCDFEPDVIYVYGDLTGSASLRGVCSVEIIKDTSIIVTVDGSQSATTESLYFSADGITGYGNSGGPHASYSNGTLTIDMVDNTSSTKFNSSITYSYELIGFGQGSGGNVNITQDENGYIVIDDDEPSGLEFDLDQVHRLQFYRSANVSDEIYVDLTKFPNLDSLESMFNTANNQSFAKVSIKPPASSGYSTRSMFYNSSSASDTHMTRLEIDGTLYLKDAQGFIQNKKALTTITGLLDLSLNANANSYTQTNYLTMIGNCAGLETVSFVPGTMTMTTTDWNLSGCAALSDASLISIANALQDTYTGTITFHATPKARLASIMGTVATSNGLSIFTEAAGGTVSLSDFLTVTKGATLG